MNLDRYELSFERKPVPGFIRARGSYRGFSAVGTFLFGGVFVGLGIFMALGGTKTIHLDPKTVYAPYWILTVAGSVFAIVGAMVWIQGWQQSLATKRSREAARTHPGEIAFQDYNWDPREFAPARWKPVIKGVAGFLFLALFLSIFNWWAFFTKAELMVIVVVSIFDGILLLVAYRVFLQIGRALKFVGSKIEFAEFPYRIPSPVKLLWKPPNGSMHATKGQFTLRCVEEFWVTTRSGNETSSTLVQEEIWSGTRFLDEPHWFLRGEGIELQFDLFADLPSTNLRASRPVFWELAVKLALPGLDFEECYLVPIYGAVTDMNTRYPEYREIS